MFVGPFEVLHGYPPRSSLSSDHSRTPCFFEARAPRDSTEDRRTGLNMNYSIIFTEISFSPETSILLQIIQIIHMTIGIMPTEKGGQSVSSGSKAANTM